MALLANYPLALAPGMGLNAYFTFSVVKGMGIPWPVALGCVFISGCCFLLLTVVGVRQLIVNAIPRPLFAAVAGGNGLFIAFIGFKHAGLIVADPATTVALGNLHAPGPLLAIVGLVLIAALNAWRVKGAVLIGILVTSVIAWLLHLVSYTPQPYSLSALTETVGKLDIKGALNLGKGGLGILEIIFVFLFVDLFDNVGTLVAVSKKAGLVDADGKIPRLNRILTADSLATIAGAFFGTSTVTSYVESAAGVEAGGRTGLTAITTGVLFLIALFFAPYAQYIPSAATAPALIIVGSMMMKPLTEIEWGRSGRRHPGFSDPDRHSVDLFDCQWPGLRYHRLCAAQAAARPGDMARRAAAWPCRSFRPSLYLPERLNDDPEHYRLRRL